MTVAKLMQNGELRVKGIDTRLPLVTDGLVAHYPMDGTTKGVANNNILDYSTWKIGTSGNQTGFEQNGDGNSIVEDVGPFGESQAIWQSLGNDTTSDADGGWNGSSFAIDRTKKYRHSVWIRRKVTGNGTGYFGCLGYSVYNITANTVNTNPYFWNGSFSNNDWLLFVSYVYPSDIGNIVPIDDAGIYNTTKTKLSSIGTFKFSPTATTNNHRTYLYYSTIATTNQQWVYPRVDLCDGTEPSIDDLLSGEGNVINISSGDNYTLTNDGVAVEEATTNIIHGFPNPNIGYNITRTVSNIPNPFDDTAEVQQWEVATSSLAYNGWAFNVTAGLRYTGSIIMFDPYNVYSDSTMLHDSATDFTSKTSSIVDLGNGWKKVIKSGTAVTTKLVSHGFIFYINAIAGNKLWVSQPQIEQKAFATEYVNGSRSASGTLILPTNIGTDDFTVTGTFIPNYNSDTLPNSSYILNLGGGFKLSTYNGQPFIDGNTIAGSGNNNVHIDFNSMTGDEITYIIKRSGTTFTWRMMDSRQDITWTKVHANVATINVSNITYHGSWGGVHSNLSIYNRVLSDDEVNTIIKGTHKFTLNGLITNGINTTGEIRYIRDYINGSTANAGNHWVEIKANTQDGINIALGKVPTSNTVLTNKSYITDGVISSAYSEGSGAGLSYVQIDLGAMYLIDNIQVWHYYPDLRTYYNTRTQVSHDGVKWYDVFNSANDGTYQETINGKTHYVGGSGSSAMSAKVSGLSMNGINSTATL